MDGLRQGPHPEAWRGLSTPPPVPWQDMEAAHHDLLQSLGGGSSADTTPVEAAPLEPSRWLPDSHPQPEASQDPWPSPAAAAEPGKEMGCPPWECPRGAGRPCPASARLLSWAEKPHTLQALPITRKGPGPPCDHPLCPSQVRAAKSDPRGRGLCQGRAAGRARPLLSPELRGLLASPAEEGHPAQNRTPSVGVAMSRRRRRSRPGGGTCWFNLTGVISKNGSSPPGQPEGALGLLWWREGGTSLLSTAPGGRIPPCPVRCTLGVLSCVSLVRRKPREGGGGGCFRVLCFDINMYVCALSYL